MRLFCKRRTLAILLAGSARHLNKLDKLVVPSGARFQPVTMGMCATWADNLAELHKVDGIQDCIDGSCFTRFCSIEEDNKVAQTVISHLQKEQEGSFFRFGSLRKYFQP